MSVSSLILLPLRISDNNNSQIGQGSFQKAWIRLRHVIAIAELIGLPKTFQAPQLNKTTRATDDETQLRRGQLWELICAADRLLGMIINLPPDISHYKQTNDQELAIDGVVQPRVYLSKLIDIAGKIQYLDDMNTTHGSSTKLYTSALEVARELRALASQTPDSWWARDVERVEPDHIVQFTHYYIAMRVHLPFILRQDLGDEYFYSRFACMDACESLVQRYQFLRRMLPPGFFLSGMLDLQAFTATVILLLISHSSPSTHRLNLRIDKARIGNEVGQVIKLMREKSDSTPGSHFAQNGVTTLCSLNKLLQEDENATQVHQLTLKVPLLGKLNIRRNVRPSQAPKADNAWSFQVPSELGLWKPNEQLLPPPLSTNTLVGPALGAQEDWQWDSLSWSIEDNYENFFQDALMADNFDQFAM